jgi:hypothetical protein
MAVTMLVNANSRGFIGLLKNGETSIAIYAVTIDITNQASATMRLPCPFHEKYMPIAAVSNMNREMANVWYIAYIFELNDNTPRSIIENTNCIAKKYRLNL